MKLCYYLHCVIDSSSCVKQQIAATSYRLEDCFGQTDWLVIEAPLPARILTVGEELSEVVFCYG